MQAGAEAQATASLRAGRWQEALDACAGQLGPDAPDALLCAAARACLALDDAGRAEVLLRQAIATHGADSAGAGLLREWMLADQRLAEIEPLLGAASAGNEATLLAAIRAHLGGDFARAATLAQSVLARDPAHPAALNHLARALHNLGRAQEALALLRRATAAEPLYAEGWHNLAHALRAAGQLQEAIEAYRRALALRPGYRSAALNLAKTWLALDRPQEALPVLDAWLARRDGDSDARVDRGIARQLLGRLEEAEADYADALRMDAGNGTAWMYLGALRNERGDRAGATEALERAAALAPGDPDVWAELATLHEVDNQVEAMGAALRRGLAIAPSHPRLQLEAARHERRSGHADAAFARLRRLPPAQLPERMRAGYWYEAGRVLDRLGRSDEAFSAFVEGNRLAASGLALRGADAALMPQLVAALQRWLSTADTHGWASGPQPAPVFLLGFPRSGITLLNLLLAGHPSVTALMERPTVEACADALSRRAAGYPGSLDDPSPALWAEERARYAAQVHRHAGATLRPLLVDAFPLRSMHAGLVARLFPGVRVVFVQRHPADVVLSNFMQEYSANAANVQFLSLEAGARFYRDTLALWHAGLAKLPLQVANVRYESLIAQPEETLRGLADFLGLDYDAAMLAGQATRAREQRIETSSYHQVAEALHDRSIGRWERYRRHLEPVLPLLVDAASTMGYAF